MKKQRFLVYTEYVFDGVFDVVAESKEEARQKVLQNCGLAMGGSIHSTLYVVKQKCTTLPPIKFGVLVRIINKKVYLHNDNKKEFFSKS